MISIFMQNETNDVVREYLLNRYKSQIESRGIRLENVRDDFDFLKEGVVDSLGIMELITDIETHFGKAVDFEGLEAEQLTVLGPLSAYIKRALMMDSH